MKFLHYMWRKLTQTKALELAGPLESAFFESVYRLSFITGLSTSEDNIQYTVYCSSVRLASALVVSCEIWRVISDDLTMDEIISCLNVIFIHLLTFWKLTTMVSNKAIFKELAKAMESPCFDISTTGRQKIVQYWSSTHRKFFKILITLACVTLAVWYTFPLIDEVEYNLMIDIKLPFSYTSPFRYTITYILVGIMFNYASFLVVMSEIIMQAHLIPLICQYDVLADCFENVFEECAKEFTGIMQHELVNSKIFVEIYIKRLGELVTQHRDLLDQTTDLKTILSAPMLGQLACSGLLICCVGYQATATIAENRGKFLMSLLYLGYNMFTLYLVCRWCEEITSQSHRIGESAYFSVWENGISQAPGVRASIMLVIVRANRPLVFLAGGMYTLSLSSYTSIHVFLIAIENFINQTLKYFEKAVISYQQLVKTSYSALTVLLRVRHE